MSERPVRLGQREQQIVDRERDLAEQRRVLAEQQRILRAATAPAAQPLPVAAAALATAEPAARTPVAPHWPPRREPPPARSYRYVAHRRETRSFWRRVRDTLFGIEPVLEDSL